AVRLAGARQWLRQERPGRADNVDVESVERKTIARLGLDMDVFTPYRFVNTKAVRRHSIRSQRHAVIDKSENRQPLGEVGAPADMVVVKMSDQQVIDMIDMRLACCRDDPLGVARVAAGIPCVNQQRLSCG